MKTETKEIATEKKVLKRVALRNGNQMAAEGAIAAGCKFFAGYPITPASGVYKGLIDLLPAHNGIAISSPDEISALAGILCWRIYAGI